jgi:hypothetical protein
VIVVTIPLNAEDAGRSVAGRVVIIVWPSDVIVVTIPLNAEDAGRPVAGRVVVIV